MPTYRRENDEKWNWETRARVYAVMQWQWENEELIEIECTFELYFQCTEEDHSAWSSSSCFALRRFRFPHLFAAACFWHLHSKKIRKKNLLFKFFTAVDRRRRLLRQLFSLFNCSFPIIFRFCFVFPFSLKYFIIFWWPDSLVLCSSVWGCCKSRGCSISVNRLVLDCTERERMEIHCPHCETMCVLADGSDQSQSPVGNTFCLVTEITFLHVCCSFFLHVVSLVNANTAPTSLAHSFIQVCLIY